MLDKGGFKQLFDNYFDVIRRFIYYRCGNTDVASDIAQDVFMKVWEKRDRLNSENLKSLLYKIANDLVVSNYRKHSTRLNFEQSMTTSNDTPLSPDDELSFKEFSLSYAKALKQMSEAQRVVFLMSRNDELKYSEISECLNISVKAVEKRMSGALQFLRSELL